MLVARINLIPYINFLGGVGFLSIFIGILIFQAFVKKRKDDLSKAEKLAYYAMTWGWAVFSICYLVLLISGEKVF